jgi:type VI secretion system secreted protein Hcp
MRGAVALEGLESRLLLSYVPVTTQDAVYDLVIDGINNASSPIRAAAFSVGLSRQVSGLQGTSGDDRDASPVSLSEMGLTVPSGRFSTAFMQAAFDGRTLAHATLVAHSPNDPSREYERWTLDDVVVTQYQTGGSSGGLPFDSISLTYAKVGFQVTPRDTADKPMPPVATGWDATTAKLVGTVPGYGGQFFDPARDLVLEFAGGQIPITSYSWSVVHDPAAGAGSAAQVAEFSFQADGGIHSPALFANTTAKGIADAVLTSRDAAGRVYSRWVLDDALLTSYSVGDGGGDSAPRSETFSLNVARMERAYYEYDSKGKVTTTQVGWDLTTARDYTTGSLDPGTGFGTFDPVSPSPRNAPVSALTLRFAERLAGADSPANADFALFRDGQRIALSGVSASTTDGGTTWQINGLAALTARAGQYTFNFFAAESGLETADGDDIVQGDTVSWVMDTTVPTITAASAQPESGAPLVVRVTFSDAVTGLAANDLKLTSAASPFVSYQPTAVTWVLPSRTAKFTFATALADGNYTAVMANDAVTNPAGSPLAAGLSLPTFMLAGDANRDRAVNFADLLTLAKNYNATGRNWSQGDFTGDGVVNFNDLLVLARSYNKALPAPAPAPVMATAPAPTPAMARSVVRDEPAGTSVFSTTRGVKPPPPKPAVVKPKSVARPMTR